MDANTVDELVEKAKTTSPKYTDVKLIERVVRIVPDVLLRVLQKETNVPSKYDILIINEVNRMDPHYVNYKNKVLTIYSERKISYAL